MSNQHETGAAVRGERSAAAGGRDPSRAEARDEPRATASTGARDVGTAAPEIRPGGSLPASPALERRGAADRAQDADLLLDVSRLTVDELTLEVQASVGLDHVKLDAKGLDASLFLKGSLDNLVALRGEPSMRPRPMGPVRRAARWAAPELPVAGRSRRGDAEDAATPEGETRAPEEAGDQDDGIRAVLDGVRRRAATVAKEGGKAASVAVVGAAGGALLESKLGPRHRRRFGLPKALGGRGGRSMPSSLLSAAEGAPQALSERIKQRLP